MRLRMSSIVGTVLKEHGRLRHYQILADEELEKS